MGRPFSEEDEDTVNKVVPRCILERLKNLDVNKGNARSVLSGIPKDYFLLDWGLLGIGRITLLMTWLIALINLPASN